MKYAIILDLEVANFCYNVFNLPLDAIDFGALKDIDKYFKSSGQKHVFEKFKPRFEISKVKKSYDLRVPDHTKNGIFLDSKVGQIRKNDILLFTFENSFFVPYFCAEDPNHFLIHGNRFNNLVEHEKSTISHELGRLYDHKLCEPGCVSIDEAINRNMVKYGGEGVILKNGVYLIKIGDCIIPQINKYKLIHTKLNELFNSKILV